MNENRLTIKDAAKLMGVSEQFVRIALQRGILPWGYAVQITGKKYTYFFSKEKFTDHTGLAVS